MSKLLESNGHGVYQTNTFDNGVLADRLLPLPGPTTPTLFEGSGGELTPSPLLVGLLGMMPSNVAQRIPSHQHVDKMLTRKEHMLPLLYKYCYSPSICTRETQNKIQHERAQPTDG